MGDAFIELRDSSSTTHVTADCRSCGWRAATEGRAARGEDAHTRALRHARDRQHKVHLTRIYEHDVEGVAVTAVDRRRATRGAP